jgi:hypothetical protein
MLGFRIQKLYLFCSQSVVPMCRTQLLFKCATKQQSAMSIKEGMKTRNKERKKRETASEKEVKKI